LEEVSDNWTIDLSLHSSTVYLGKTEKDGVTFKIKKNITDKFVQCMCMFLSSYPQGYQIRCTKKDGTLQGYLLKMEPIERKCKTCADFKKEDHTCVLNPKDIQNTRPERVCKLYSPADVELPYNP